MNHRRHESRQCVAGKVRRGRDGCREGSLSVEAPHSVVLGVEGAAKVQFGVIPLAHHLELVFTFRQELVCHVLAIGVAHIPMQTSQHGSIQALMYFL